MPAIKANAPRKQAGVSLAERVYTDLKTALHSGRFEPGERVREEAVADWLQVSRTPVREALRRLASEQLVAFEPHLGVRVPGWSHRDIEEIFALRVELESYAAGQAARHASPAQVAELRELARQIEQAAFGGAEPVEQVRLRFCGEGRRSWESARGSAPAR